MTGTIYTIGHGSDGFDHFVDRLRPHGVTTIADVRSQPTSRHAKDFRKRDLERAAASLGLGYRWLGHSLGGRPDDPALLTGEGEPDWRAITEGDEFRSGIIELLGLTHTGTVVVMCSEVDPRWCHRSTVIAPALEAAGHVVVDILGDGVTSPHQATLGD